MIYLTLYLEFFKIGLFNFGGGLAAVPFLQDLSEKYMWYSAQQLVDFIAISESTPGPIAINIATFAGFEAAGILGSVMATIGIISPALVLISLVAKFLAKFKTNKYVKWVFYGLRPCVLALIAFALVGLVRVTLLNAGACWLNIGAAVNIKSIGIFALVLLLSNVKKLKDLHPVIFLALGAALGILVNMPSL